MAAKDSKSPAANNAKSPAEVKKAGKAKPTQKRKIAEQQILRPIIVKDRKAARKAARSNANSQRELEYNALRSGDTDNMPIKDRGPEKFFIRNWVDSQFSISELFMPLAVVMVILMFMPSLTENRDFSLILVITVYGFLAICAIEIFLKWRIFKTAFAKKFGANTPIKGKGHANYFLMRMVQFRKIRLPKPVSKEFIERELRNTK